MTLAPASVRLLVCGTADRGDDGAALAAVAHLLPTLALEICERLEVRRCSQLDPSDIIDVRPGTACLIVDAAVGLVPGTVVTMPLSELAARPVGVSPRSSHALPVDQVIALAETIRGTLPLGSFVGIGAKWFDYGPRFSRAVRAGLPDLEAAILSELIRMTGAGALHAPA
jgi:hydrogenase maturation protease